MVLPRNRVNNRLLQENAQKNTIYKEDLDDLGVQLNTNQFRLQTSFVSGFSGTGTTSKESQSTRNCS